MNAVVFVLAGMFVLAGLVLIVLSFFVFRKRKSTEVQEESFSAGVSGQLEKAVQHSVTGPQAEHVPEEPKIPTLPDLNKIVYQLHESPAPTADISRRNNYDLRVTLGFRFLLESMFEEAVVEFHKATTFTDREEDLVKLYVEIGNSFKARGMLDPARAGSSIPRALNELPISTYSLTKSSSRSVNVAALWNSTTASSNMLSRRKRKPSVTRRS